jgi:hypothetical protein
MEVSGQLHTPAALPPGKELLPYFKILDWRIPERADENHKKL